MSQNDQVFWSNHYPGFQPDSALVLTSNVQFKRFTKRDSLQYSLEELKKMGERKEIARKLYYEDSYPLNADSVYRRFYQKSFWVSASRANLDFFILFKTGSCNSYPINRCRPVYRDCVVYYKDGKQVFALKICRSCDAVASTPSKENAKCIANDMQAINDYFIKTGIANLWED